MSRFRFVIPNLLTAANVGMGMLSILAAARGQFDLAVYLLVAAVILDMADGPAARLLKGTSRFGQQMDSLSDCASFCVAPALLVYWAVLHELGRFGTAVVFVYLICGVLRLARFNVSEDAHSKSHRSVGLPVPVSAGYLMAVALMRDHLTPVAAVAVVLFMAGMMISRLPLPNTKGKKTVAAVLVAVLNYVAVVIWPNWYTVAWWNIWNVVLVVVAAREARQFDARQVAGDATGRTSPA